MPEIKINDLPVILESDFTDNDRFLIVDDGKARLMTKPVFESWVANNLQGERGIQGVAGRDGINGKDGKDGVNGTTGLSAFQLAVSNGYFGDLASWLESLRGAKGERGLDGGNGWSPLIKTKTRVDDLVIQIYDWVGGVGVKPLLGYLGDTGIVTNIASATNIKGVQGLRGFQGDIGLKGETGVKGETGSVGLTGDSAYQVALIEGFVGTQEEWVLSLNAATVSLEPNNSIIKKIDGLFSPEVTPTEVLDLEGASTTSAISQRVFTDRLAEIDLEILELRGLITAITPEP